MDVAELRDAQPVECRGKAAEGDLAAGDGDEVALDFSGVKGNGSRTGTGSEETATGEKGLGRGTIHCHVLWYRMQAGGLRVRIWERRIEGLG